MEFPSPQLPIVLCALLGYLIGGFPTGVVLSRRKYGIDVREMGSGNIGATNITRNFGWYAGVLTFLVDALKGYLPVWLLAHYVPENPWLATLTGAFLVLGHCFSPYLKLRGGKGVATSVGCLAALAPWGALAATAVYGSLLAATRISAIGSLGGLATILTYAWLGHPPGPVRTLIYCISFVVLVRHRTNVVRLIEGYRSKKEKK